MSAVALLSVHLMYGTLVIYFNSISSVIVGKSARMSSLILESLVEPLGSCEWRISPFFHRRLTRYWYRSNQ
ncbi:hypothetical protein QBC37DRAFT_460897 [Rhypophila decipiens]|uniref:Uncharacterized protein n=1 Tax=Rhypophila decipiens TaxID=261697 RepID=A0AAN6YA14_9PEZI|nr:hypothetical protein QBC37DRAFT_460897 [Rhypophila decipiens]